MAFVTPSSPTDLPRVLEGLTSFANLRYFPEEDLETIRLAGGDVLSEDQLKALNPERYKEIEEIHRAKRFFLDHDDTN